MGLPQIVIEFQKKRSTFIHRLGRGMVAIPFVNAAFTTSVVASATDPADIATALGSGFPEDQKTGVTAEMTRALENGASKAIVVCAKDATTAETLLSAQRFNYLAMGNLENTDQTTLATWAEGRKYACGRNFMIFGAASVLDEETDGHLVALDDVNLTEENSTTAAISGVFAGLSEESGTYHVMNTNTDGTGYATKDQADADNDKGIITVFFDGEKAKLSRAVTTYYAEDPESPYAKIRNVDTMNRILCGKPNGRSPSCPVKDIIDDTQPPDAEKGAYMTDRANRTYCLTIFDAASGAWVQVPVTAAVYRAWWQEEERERYREMRAAERECHWQGAAREDEAVLAHLAQPLATDARDVQRVTREALAQALAAETDPALVEALWQLALGETTQEALARQWGVTPSAVSHRIARAHARLRRRLEEYA